MTYDLQLTTGDCHITIVQEPAYHGGAWKVAYADFVTAMMAFFLLMWLLNATEADQLAGLADYFAPTLGVQGEKGIGFRGGKAALSDGIGADINTNKGIVFGGVPSGPVVKVTERLEVPTHNTDAEQVIISEGSSGSEEGEGSDAEELSFAYAQEQLEQEIRAIDGQPGLHEAIDITQSIEGLMIQIKDTKEDSMFEESTPILKERAKLVLNKVAKVIRNLPNFISLTGHATEYYIGNDPDYTIWELSADRANAARRYLLQQGVQEDRVFRVIGKGDNEPVVEQRPDLPQNNRITIVLLRDAILPFHKQVIPEGLFDETAEPEAVSVTESIPTTDAEEVPEGEAESDAQ